MFDMNLNQMIDEFYTLYPTVKDFEPSVSIQFFSESKKFANISFFISRNKLSLSGAKLLAEDLNELKKSDDFSYTLTYAEIVDSSGNTIGRLTPEVILIKNAPEIGGYKFIIFVASLLKTSANDFVSNNIISFNKTGAIEIAVDLDGTLIEDKFPYFGSPIQRNVEIIRTLKDLGYRITIFTARLTVNPNERTKIENFLKKHNIPYDKLTNQKPHTASVFIDDRNIEVGYNKEWPKDIIDTITNIIKKHKKYKSRKKSNLEHPNSIIFTKNKYYLNGLTEQKIYDYYSNVATKILAFIKNKPLMLVIRTPNGDIIRKNDFSNGDITVNTIEDFNSKINNGRTIEIHRIIQDNENFAVVDVDPRPDVPFDKTKYVTKELVNFLTSVYSDILKEINIYFSGNRGFHIYLIFREQKDVNEMRKLIHKNLEDFLKFILKDKKVMLELPKNSDEIRLDITIFHPGGSIRVPYSLHKETGLAAIPVKNIDNFNPEHAKIEKTSMSYLNLFSLK